MMAAREPDEDDVTPFKCARSDDDDSESGMSQIKRRSTSVTTNRDSMINDDYLCDKPIGAEGEHKWTITTRVGDVIVPFAGNAVAGGKCGKRLARRSLVPHQRSCLCFSATDAIKSDGTQVERKPLLAAFHECVLGMIDEQERDGINHAIVHREPHGWCIDLNLLKDTELPLRNTFARMLVEFTKSSGCRNAFADISPHWWGMLTVGASGRPWRTVLPLFTPTQPLSPPPRAPSLPTQGQFYSCLHVSPLSRRKPLPRTL